MKEKKKAYIAGLGRDQLEHLASSKYQRVQDKSETIEKRLESGLESETGLEYYSPSTDILKIGVSIFTGFTKLMIKLKMMINIINSISQCVTFSVFNITAHGKILIEMLYQIYFVHDLAYFSYISYKQATF